MLRGALGSCFIEKIESIGIEPPQSHSLPYRLTCVHANSLFLVPAIREDVSLLLSKGHLQLYSGPCLLKDNL